MSARDKYRKKINVAPKEEVKVDITPQVSSPQPLFIQNLQVTTDAHLKLQMAVDNNVTIPKSFIVSSSEMTYYKGEQDLLGKYPTGTNEFTGKLKIGPADSVLYCTVSVFTRNNVFADVDKDSYNQMYQGMPYNAIATAFGSNEITTHSHSFVGTKVASFVAYESKTPRRIMATGLEIVPTSISVAATANRAMYWGNPNVAKPNTLTNAKTYDEALNTTPIVVDSKQILIGNYYSSTDSVLQSDFGSVSVELVKSNQFGYFKMGSGFTTGIAVNFICNGKIYYNNKPLATIWKIENPTSNNYTIKVHSNRMLFEFGMNGNEWGYIISPELNFSHKIEIHGGNHQVQTVSRPVSNNLFESKTMYKANGINASSLILGDVDYPSDVFLKNAQIVKANGVAELVLTLEKGLNTVEDSPISPNTLFRIDVNH